MAVKYVKDFDFSKGTAACNYAKGGSAKKPAGMMIVIGVGKPKGPMRKAEGGSISDSDRRMMEQMAGDANAYTEAQRIMGQGATSDADRSAMKAATAKKKAAPAAKKGSPYIPGTNVKANDLYTKEELERLERGYKKGGMAKHPDEAMDKALIKKMVKPGVLKKADGGMAQNVQMAKSNAVAASLKGQKKTGYADGGMAMDNIVKAAAGRPMPGQQIPADVMSRYAASPGAGGMASIKSPLQRMSRAKGVPVASEMPMIESKSSGPKSIGVNAKRPGGPNVGKIRAAMARAASKAVPENAPSMMKKGGKVK